MALIAAALAVRLIIPAGFMPDVKHLGIVICTGHGPVAATIAIPHDHSGPADSGGKPDQPCGFGGGLTGSLVPLDPLILLAAIAFVLALGRASDQPLRLRALAWLRPPLRGPPVTFQV